MRLEQLRADHGVRADAVGSRPGAGLPSMDEERADILLPGRDSEGEFPASKNSTARASSSLAQEIPLEHEDMTAGLQLLFVRMRTRSSTTFN